MVECSILLHEEHYMFDVTQRPAPDNPGVDKKEQPDVNHCESCRARIRRAVPLYRFKPEELEEERIRELTTVNELCETYQDAKVLNILGRRQI
jgi:hypothetical protein